MLSDAKGLRWETGTGVHARIWHAEAPMGTVMFMHGYGDYLTRYVKQGNGLIPKLVSAGFSVCGFDLRGHGLSPGRRAITDVGQAVRDHLAARRALSANDLPRFLLGHSLGGLVSVCSALEEPGNLAGLILLAPVLQAPASMKKFDHGAGRFLLQAAAAIWPGWPVYTSTSLKDLTADNTLFRPTDEYTLKVARQLHEDTLFYKGSMPAILPATTMTISRKYTKRFHELTLPVLAIHGTRDKAAPHTGSVRFISEINSYDTSLELIDGAYHNLLDDLDRDRVVALITAWLKARV